MIIGHLIIGSALGFIALGISFAHNASLLNAIIAYAITGVCGTVGSAAIYSWRSRQSTSDIDLSNPRHQTEIIATTSNQPVESIEKSELIDKFLVLAVDDDPSILELVSLISGTLDNLEIVTSSSAREALAILQEGNSLFDCILADISMPEIDGIELCTHIRAAPQYSRTSIIMLTAMRDFHYMDRAFEAGANDYITKPFDIKDFTSRLLLALNSGTKPTLVERSDKTLPHIDYDPFRELTVPGGNAGSIDIMDHASWKNYLAKIPAARANELLIFSIIIDQFEELTRALPPEALRTFSIELLQLLKAAVGSRNFISYEGSGALFMLIDETVHYESLAAKINNLKYSMGRDDPPIQLTIGKPLRLPKQKASRDGLFLNRVLLQAKTESSRSSYLA